MLRKERLLISVKESRKLLGIRAKDLTNKEVKQLIIDSELLARFAVRQNLVRKTGMLK